MTANQQFQRTPRPSGLGAAEPRRSALVLSTIFLVLLTQIGCHRLSQLPDGWRFPVEEDYVADWQEFRKEVPAPYHARGDFNSDGLPDDAWILLRTSGKGFGVFALLGQPQGRSKLIQLLDSNNDIAQQYGIALVEPGDHQTACGKGYSECGGDPEVLHLSTQAIEFFKYESASRIYYWDKSAGVFRQVQISD